MATNQPKPAFRPWNSFLAKKGAAEAASIAAQHAQRDTVPTVKMLTAGLIDTYEGINHSYYHQRQPTLGRAVAGEASFGTAAAGVAGAAAAAAGGRAAAAAAPAVSAAAPMENAAVKSAARRINLLEARIDEAGAIAAAQGGGQNGGEQGAVEPVEEDDDEFSGGQYCDKNYDYIVRPGDMFHNRYMLEKVIGRGSFGQVVRAYDTRTNAHVAIKIIKNNALYVEQALSEVRMTAYLNRIDPDDAYAIMRIFDKFIFRGHQCLVLELLSFSLYDLLRSTEFYGVSLNLVRKFCKQILTCLCFLSRPDVNIAHCDLKPENVLLRHPQRSAIKVVDFGASCRISDSMFNYVQSRFYRAPEVILGLQYNTQVDVWSLGCMLVELHTGYPLFAGRDEADQIAVIVERLGIPPKHMLDAGKKTELFFERVPVSDPASETEDGSSADNGGGGDGWEWALRQDIGKNPGEIVAGSKPIQGFVDDLTSGSSGKRKRVSGGHSESDYEVFLDLAKHMLRYDPSDRLSSSEALNNAFVSGASLSSSALIKLDSDREPPVRIPAQTATTSSQVQAGRAAPLQPRSSDGTTVGSEPRSKGAEDDVGGMLRLSKSESAIAPIPALIFHSSDWAEEVGIDPPAWRAEGPGALLAAHLRGLDAGEDEESLVCADRPVLRPAAGCGAPLGGLVRVIKPRPPTTLPTIFGRVVGPRVLSTVFTTGADQTNSNSGPLPPSGHCAILRRVECL